MLSRLLSFYPHVSSSSSGYIYAPKGKEGRWEGAKFTNQMYETEKGRRLVVVVIEHDITISGMRL